jgi:hypothetical protein
MKFFSLRPSIKNFSFVILFTILTTLIFFAWRDLPKMIMRGDGFVYLVKRTQIQYWNPPSTLANFDQGATLAARMLTSLFKANISYYYWLELIFLVIIGVLFFVFVYVITQKISIAFMAAIIFSVNYFGNFNMFAAYGAYSFFLERIINMVMIIPSFIYLHLFLEKKLWKHFALSVVFYFFAVGLSHWFVLFTPAFCLYPISWYLFREKNKKNFARYVLTSFSYFFMSAFFILLQQINQSGLNVKKWGFIEFLLHPQKFQYPEKIIRQLVYWTGYVPSYNYLPDVKMAISITPYIIVLYLIINIISYVFLKNDKKYLIFWSFLSCLTIFYLNSYFGQYDILNQYGANRYLYLPTFLLAIFWAVSLWLVFFKNSKKLFVVLGTFLVGLFYLMNSSLINDNFKLCFQWDKPTKLLYQYIINNNYKFPQNALIIMPNNEFKVYENEFFNDYLGKGDVFYVDDKDSRLANIKKGRRDIYEIKYSPDCDCVLENKIR